MQNEKCKMLNERKAKRWEAINETVAKIQGICSAPEGPKRIAGGVSPRKTGQKL
jgi:hypothetical protein